MNATKKKDKTKYTRAPHGSEPMLPSKILLLFFTVQIINYVFKIN